MCGFWERSRHLRFAPASRVIFALAAFLWARTGLGETPASGGGSAWWIWLSAGIVAVAAFLAVLRLYTRGLEAERRRLEETVAALRAEVAAAKSELDEVTFSDSLTGLRNRRYFSASIDGEVLRVLRAYAAAPAGEGPAHRDLIFYLIDLDDFKAVNDLYGHGAGDRVLAEMAARLNSIARQSDVVCRWGGEEFLIVCRDAQRRDAEVLAARILEAIGRQSFDAGGGREARLTCSVGWAVFPWLTDNAPSRSYEEVLTIADRARQLAKATGKNRAFGALPDDANLAAREDGSIKFRTTVAMGPEA